MYSDLKFLFSRVQFKTRKHYQTKINIASTMKQLIEYNGILHAKSAL